jgi:hypothetical protein
MIKYIVFLLILLAVSSKINAQGIVIIGTGQSSCGEWVQAHKMQKDIYEQWVTGYISSYNYYSAKPIDNVPNLETISLWLDVYCKRNPTDIILLSASALIQHLGGQPALHKWRKP